MPTADAIFVGEVCIDDVSHIAKTDARTFFRNLTQCDSGPFTHNANMIEEDTDSEAKNGGPNHVTAWREHFGLKGTELAARLKTSAGNLSDLEKGQRGLSLRWLRRIAGALDIPVAYLTDYPPSAVPSDIRAAISRSGAHVPAPETLAQLLAAVLLADEDDPVQQAAIQDASEALHVALTRLASNPANESDPGYLRAVCDGVRQGVSASPIPPSAARSRKKPHKMDTDANTQT